MLKSSHTHFPYFGRVPNEWTPKQYTALLRFTVLLPVQQCHLLFVSPAFNLLQDPDDINAFSTKH